MYDDMQPQIWTSFLTCLVWIFVDSASYERLLLECNIQLPRKINFICTSYDQILAIKR